MPGTLYIVATPIGNLADITLRALSTLREVDLVAAEDTRVSHNLLTYYGIDTPTTPYHQHSLGRKAQHLIDQLLDGKNIAVVSDAGMPGISDPGHELITLAIENGIQVVAVPGASATILALVVSGLPTQRFCFDGFPPRGTSDRREFFHSLREERRTIVLYESPHRLLKTLSEMLAALGDRRIAVVREATKVFEEVHRGTISSAIQRFTELKPRGEFTIVVAGYEPVEPSADQREEDLTAALENCLAEGLSERDAVRKVAESLNLPRKEVYQRMLDLKKHSD